MITRHWKQQMAGRLSLFRYGNGCSQIQAEKAEELKRFKQRNSTNPKIGGMHAKIGDFRCPENPKDFHEVVLKNHPLIGGIPSVKNHAMS